MVSTAFQRLPEGFVVQRVTAQDQAADATEESVLAVGEVPPDPRSAWTVCDPGDLHPAGLDVDHEEDEVADQTTEREHLDGEEVGRGDLAEVGPDERLPRGLPGPPGCRLDAVIEKNPLDGVPADLVAEVPKSVPDSGVAPGWAFGCHPDDQPCDLRARVGATRTAPLRPIVLLGDEMSVPAKDRVGRDDAGDLPKGLSADGLALDREASAQVVSEAKAASSELPTEEAVLLHQVVDDAVLVAADPPGVEQQEEVERGRRGGRGQGRSFKVAWPLGKGRKVSIEARGEGLRPAGAGVEWGRPRFGTRRGGVEAFAQPEPDLARLASGRGSLRWRTGGGVGALGLDR